MNENARKGLGYFRWLGVLDNNKGLTLTSSVMKTKRAKMSYQQYRAWFEGFHGT